MQENDGTASRGKFDHNDEGTDPAERESLLYETQAAAGAVAAHVGKLAATATTEAKLSIASVSAIAIAAVVSLLLLSSAWMCLIAAGVWFAVAEGLPVATALLLAGAMNIAAVVLLLLWGRSLLRNIGFSRTRKLVFPGPK